MIGGRIQHYGQIRSGRRRLLIDKLFAAFDLCTGSIHLYPIIGRVGRRGSSFVCWLSRGRLGSLRRKVLGSATIEWTINAVLGALVAVRDFDRAQELVGAVSATHAHPEDAMWRLRQLQVRCSAGQFERADALIEQWGGLGEVPEIASAVTAGYLATSRRWNEVIDFFDNRIRKGMSPQGHLFFESVAGAARHTGRYEEVLGLLARCRHSRPVESMRSAIKAEVEMKGLLQTGKLPSNQAASDPFHRDRLRVIRAIVCDQSTTTGGGTLQSAGHKEVEGTLLWCSDRNYLIGTSVSLWSCVRHNPGLDPTDGYRVVVAPDALSLASDVFAQIAESVQKEIRVIDAASLLPAHRTLRTDYGLFTPGFTLSEAAYYRLFAIQGLIQNATVGRTVYVDSDTCVGPGMEAAFDLELHGLPMAARKENPRGLRYESRRVIMQEANDRLGLPPGSYFNSGVLIINNAHLSAKSGISRAIDLVLSEPERLMFHDQCALNLSFAGLVEPLPETLNHFVRPQNPSTNRSPVVLHYLERPKPWDPLYPTVNCRRWFEELASLATGVESEHIARMLALQFR